MSLSEPKQLKWQRCACDPGGEEAEGQRPQGRCPLPAEGPVGMGRGGQKIRAAQWWFGFSRWVPWPLRRPVCITAYHVPQAPDAQRT